MENSSIDYWSYSSMSSLLSNPLAFKKKYVLKIYDDISSPSAVVGSAGHTALEMYFKGIERNEAIKIGLDQINHISDIGIDYGKTGSRAKILESYNQAINFYFEELPTFHEILGVEEGITADIETVDWKECLLLTAFLMPYVVVAIVAAIAFVGACVAVGGVVLKYAAA